MPSKTSPRKRILPPPPPPSIPWKESSLDAVRGLQLVKDKANASWNSYMIVPDLTQWLVVPRSHATSAVHSQELFFAICASLGEEIRSGVKKTYHRVPSEAVKSLKWPEHRSSVAQAVVYSPDTKTMKLVDLRPTVKYVVPADTVSTIQRRIGRNGWTPPHSSKLEDLVKGKISTLPLQKEVQLVSKNGEVLLQYSRGETELLWP